MKIKIIKKRPRLFSPTALTRYSSQNNPLLSPTARGEGVRLHPLYEAKLRVRLQFDKDIPELRYQPHLTEHYTPAVSVVSSELNFLTIGAKIIKAEGLVKDEHAKIIKEISDLHVCLWNQEGLILTNTFSIEKHQKLKEMNSYPTQFGQVPMPINLNEEEITVTNQDPQELLWKTMGQTQGRRTVVNTLLNKFKQLWGAELFSDNLAVKEFEEVSYHIPDKEYLNPQFNYEGLLLRRFTKFIEKHKTNSDYRFNIKSINNYDEAVFGWLIQAGELDEKYNIDFKNKISGLLGD